MKTLSKQSYHGVLSACVLASAICLSSLPGNAQQQTTENTPVNLSEKPVLFQIGYAHLDTQWRWSYPQVIREFLPNTVNDNIKLFAKYPHYVFNFTGAGRYKLIQEYYPEDFEKVRAAISAGRWYPNGTAWEESDVIMPSSESLIRQLLLGNEYFKREFGIESSDFILPDCFGFPASLPSILAHCGLRGFATQKLTWGSAVGIPFNVGEWIGPDGNSVIAALNGGDYNGDIKENPAFNKAWAKRIEENGKASGVFADYLYYGTGDRGGSPRDESVRLLEQGVVSDGPVRVVSARADLMFNTITDEQKARLPKYAGDMLLTEHSAGSLTSQAYMKRWNRQNELLADAAERASVAAWTLGAAAYPREKLNRAWELVLRSQMHDTLPGTCLPTAYVYAWNDEVIAMNSFAEVLTGAVGAVASGLDTRVDGTPLVIYNPLSIEREDVVEAALALAEAKVKNVQVYNGDGKPVPTQMLSQADGKCRILFLAKAPSVGFAVYSVKAVDAVAPGADSALKVSTRSLENDNYRITINDAGDIAGMFDKKAGRELLSAPARLAILNESPKEWPAWNMYWDDRQKEPRAFVGGKALIEIVENGAVRVALRVKREAEGSTFDQVIRLSAGSAGSRVEISNTIDWLGKSCSLKADFPLTVSNSNATYNWDLGKVGRGNNDSKKYEVPTHQWFDLTDKDGSHGVSILTGAKYGSDKPADNNVRLTLLYTPDASKHKFYKDQRTQDWGRHEFIYGIYSHANDWRKAGADWQAQRLEQPLRAFVTEAHAGRLGRSFSLLQVDSSAVAVRAIKLAESGVQAVVRLQELNGAPQNNIQLSALALCGASEVNGVEKFLRPLECNNMLGLDFTKYQIRSLALTLNNPAKLPTTVSVPVELPYNFDAFAQRGPKASGSFDGGGNSIPAEMIGDTVVSENIHFKIGSRQKTDKNAIKCEGQAIQLPDGNYNRIYILAAAVNGDTTGQFEIDGKSMTLPIQDWGGRIGSWDNRVFSGKIHELAYTFDNPLVSIDAGFIKRAPLAWFANHRYNKDGKDQIYAYSYLYKYSLPVADGAKTLTLPNNSDIRIVAITVARDISASTQPAGFLYDDLSSQPVPRLPKGWADFK